MKNDHQKVNKLVNQDLQKVNKLQTKIFKSNKFFKK